MNQLVSSKMISSTLLVNARYPSDVLVNVVNGLREELAPCQDIRTLARFDRQLQVLVITMAAYL